jgi:glycosyltransferase involved in cell wall biosynthesis
VKRILFVATDVGTLVANRLPVILGARERGFDVEVACVDGPAAEILRQHNIVFHVLPIDRKGTNPFVELIGLIRLLRLIVRRKPDIVHAVAIKAVLYGGLASRLARTPAFVGAIAGMGSIFIGSSGRMRRLRAVLTHLLVLALNHRNCKIIVQNPDDFDAMVQIGRVPPENIQIIRGSGVRMADYTVEPEPENTAVAVMVCRLLYDKGIREFVEAARLVKRNMPDARFVVAGTQDPGNPSSVDDETLATWNAEGIVEFIGHSNDVAQLYAMSNLAVLPSYREGLPKALIEAAACGRAVVTTDAPGCNFAIEAGKTGLLVPVKNVSALADAIQALLSNAAVRNAMGVQGRIFAENEFGIEIVVDQHLSAYESLTRT